MITYTTEPKGRLVHACCDMCHAVCDGIYQNASLSGTFASERPMLAMQGWLEFAGHDFCSRLCLDKYKYATGNRPAAPVAVTRPILPRQAPIAMQQRSSKPR